MALDARPDWAHPWIDAASPTHPSLVDRRHVTGELLGFVNVPMAVWVDEEANLVRPAELAAVERSALRDLEVPDGLPERMRTMFEQVKAIPDPSERYLAAIRDWVANGDASPFAMNPEQVLEASRPRGVDEARSAACFELGEHLFERVGHDAAVPWWREAHRLDPGNWTYKRQAWSMVTTADDATEPDLVQGPNDTYEGNWLDDVLAGGGGATYYPPVGL